MESNIIEQLELFGLQLKAHQKYNEAIEELKNPVSYHKNFIFNAIDKIVLDKKSGFLIDMPSGTSLYRARAVNSGDVTKTKGLSVNGFQTTGFDENNSIECPLGMGSEGRNNIRGVSYLYVAEDPITACVEVKTIPSQLVSLAEFMTQKELRFIDFSFTTQKHINPELSHEEDLNMAYFITRVMRRFSEPVIRKDEYYASQVISDYLRKTGIDGICYSSFFTDKRNYTIFNSHSSNIRYISSRLLYHQFRQDSFWDFNNSMVICNENKHGDYDKNAATKMINDIKAELAITKKEDNAHDGNR